MCLKYVSVQSGFLFVGSTAYLFVLIFLVIYEIDDPCSGLWYIRSIPKEWLQIDVKKFRDVERFQKAYPLFLEKHKDKLIKKMRNNIVYEGADELTYEIREIVEVGYRIRKTGLEIIWENIGDPVAKGETIPQWIKISSLIR